MAQLLFGADLSLALSHGDPDANSGIPINGIAAGAWSSCTQASGKADQPAGLVDYLGTLPVLETRVGAPISPAQSYGSIDTVNIPESISTQLTLFYAGAVNVFDNVTADKIVMSLAENSNSLNAITSLFKMPVAPSIQPSAPYGPQLRDPMKRTQTEMQKNLTATTPLYVGERLKVSEDGHAQELASLLVPCQAIVPKALPIARKASLVRFLEKRRERVRLMAPYLAKGSARDVIHRGAHHSHARTLHKFDNAFWIGPLAKKLRYASGIAYGNNVDVEDENWFTIVENSKQASECESVT